MSSVYNDLTLTNYPNAVDTKEGTNLADNADYAGGVPISSNYILAADSNTLRDAVLALQRFVGPLSGTLDGSETITEVLGSLSTGQLDSSLLDIRYGGTGYGDLVTPPSILSHVHGSGVGNSPLINLASGVTGTLKVNQLLLDGTASSLKATDIPLALGNSLKISDALNDKLSLTNGGTISGSVVFTGGVATTCFAELECETFSSVTNTTDTDTWSGKAGVIASATGGADVSCIGSTRLRYGTYGLILRAKVSANASISAIVYVTISGFDVSGNNVTYASAPLTGTSFTTANVYQEFYIPFTHTSAARKTAGLPNVRVNLFCKGTRPTISFDSIIITPINVGGWGEV